MPAGLPVGADGPTPRQFEVLHVVSKNKGISQTDLVAATGIDRSTLADMIARMLKKGLLSRSRDKEDARANNVSITPSGQRVLGSAMSGVARAEAATLNVLPKSQQTAFMKALGAYADALLAALGLQQRPRLLLFYVRHGKVVPV